MNAELGAIARPGVPFFVLALKLRAFRFDDSADLDCESPRIEDGGGPLGVKEAAVFELGGGPAGVVEGSAILLRWFLSGVKGGLEDCGAVNMFV